MLYRKRCASTSALILVLVLVLVVVLGLAACSGRIAPTEAVDGGPGEAMGSSTTLGGKPFTVMGGLAGPASGAELSIVLSDRPGLCERMTAGKLHAGEALLAASHLFGGGAGTYRTIDEYPVSYTRVKSDCAGGSPLQENLEARAYASPASVTITTITATEVSGTIVATFGDGPATSVSFTVPKCPRSDPGENATCE